MGTRDFDDELAAINRGEKYTPSALKGWRTKPSRPGYPIETADERQTAAQKAIDVLRNEDQQARDEKFEISPHEEVDPAKGLRRTKAIAGDGANRQGAVKSYALEDADLIDPDRPLLANDDGSFSTERTITIESDGKWINIPTIFDGERHDEKQAVKAWRDGKNKAVGTYDSQEEAITGAKERSKAINELRGEQMGQGEPPSFDDQMAEIAKIDEGYTPPAAAAPKQKSIRQTVKGWIDWISGIPAAVSEVSPLRPGKGTPERAAQQRKIDAAQQRRYDAANLHTAKMIDNLARQENPGERAGRLIAEAGSDKYRSGFVQNVAASISTLPDEVKGIVGGLMQYAGDRLQQGLGMAVAGAGPIGAVATLLNEAVNRLQPDQREAVANTGKVLSEMGEAVIAESDEAVEKETGHMKPGLGAQAVDVAMKSMIYVAPGLAMTIAGRLAAISKGVAASESAAAILTSMGVMTFGESYGTARKQLPPDKAAVFAAAMTLIEISTEFLPTKALLAKSPGFASTFWNFIVREVPTEMLASTLQPALEKISITPEMTAEEWGHQMLLTVISTPIAAGAQVGIVSAFSKPEMSDDRKAEIIRRFDEILRNNRAARGAPPPGGGPGGGGPTHRLEDGTPVSARMEGGKPVPGVWVNEQGDTLEAPRAEPIKKVEDNATWKVSGVDYDVAVVGKGRADGTALLSDGQEVQIDQLELADEAKITLGLAPPEPEAPATKAGAAPAKAPAAPAPAPAPAAPAAAPKAGPLAPAAPAGPPLAAGRPGPTERPGPAPAPAASVQRMADLITPAGSAPEAEASKPLSKEELKEFWENRRKRDPTEKELQRREKLSARLKRDAKRKRIVDTERDSIVAAVIKLGGLSKEYQLDISGDTKGNPQIGWIGPLWRSKGGDSPDGIGRRLAELGYLTDEEAEDPNVVSEKIRDELGGIKRHWSAWKEGSEESDLPGEEGEMYPEAEAAAGDQPLEGDISPAEFGEFNVKATAKRIAAADLASQLPEETLERLAIEYEGATEDEFLEAVRAELANQEVIDGEEDGTDRAGARGDREGGETPPGAQLALRKPRGSKKAKGGGAAQGPSAADRKGEPKSETGGGEGVRRGAEVEKGKAPLEITDEAIEAIAQNIVPDAKAAMEQIQHYAGMIRDLKSLKTGKKLTQEELDQVIEQFHAWQEHLGSLLKQAYERAGSHRGRGTDGFEALAKIIGLDYETYGLRDYGTEFLPKQVGGDGPNIHAVYEETEILEKQLAGQSSISIRLAKTENGLTLWYYSYWMGDGGGSGPITIHRAQYSRIDAIGMAADLLRRQLGDGTRMAKTSAKAKRDWDAAIAWLDRLPKRGADLFADVEEKDAQGIESPQVRPEGEAQQQQGEPLRSVPKRDRPKLRDRKKDRAQAERLSGLIYKRDTLEREAKTRASIRMREIYGPGRSTSSQVGRSKDLTAALLMLESEELEKRKGQFAKLERSIEDARKGLGRSGETDVAAVMEKAVESGDFNDLRWRIENPDDSIYSIKRTTVIIENIEAARQRTGLARRLLQRIKEAGADVIPEELDETSYPFWEKMALEGLAEGDFFLDEDLVVKPTRAQREERLERVAKMFDDQGMKYEAQKVRYLLKATFPGVKDQASHLDTILDEFEDKALGIVPFADRMEALAKRYEAIGLTKDAEALRARKIPDESWEAKVSGLVDVLEKPLPETIFDKVISTGRLKPFMNRVDAANRIRGMQRGVKAGTFEIINVGDGVAIRVIRWPGGVTKNVESTFELASQTPEDLKQKEAQAATGTVETTTAVRPRPGDEITLTTPPGYVETKVTPAPIQQLKLFQEGAPYEVIVHASGMSRPTDFETLLAENGHVGVDIGQLSDAAIDRLAVALGNSTGTVFVDSGAFSIFRANARKLSGPQFSFKEFGVGGQAIDFDTIMSRYERLARKASEASEAAGGSAANRLVFVMPDLVGDQAGSIELARQYAEHIRDFTRYGRAIVPIQAGDLTLLEAFDAIVEIVGTDVALTVGIPSAVAAAPNEQLTELLRERGADMEGVHFLGAGSRKRVGPRMEAVFASGFDGEVSADANILRSRLYGSTDRAAALRSILKQDSFTYIAPTAAPEPAAPAEPRSLEGLQIELDVSIEQTGKIGKLRLDAGRAIQDAEQRIQIAKDLLECL